MKNKKIQICYMYLTKREKRIMDKDLKDILSKDPLISRLVNKVLEITKLPYITIVINGSLNKTKYPYTAYTNTRVKIIQINLDKGANGYTIYPNIIHELIHCLQNIDKYRELEKKHNIFNGEYNGLDLSEYEAYYVESQIILKQVLVKLNPLDTVTIDKLIAIAKHTLSTVKLIEEEISKANCTTLLNDIKKSAKQLEFNLKMEQEFSLFYMESFEHYTNELMNITVSLIDYDTTHNYFKFRFRTTDPYTFMYSVNANTLRCTKYNLPLVQQYIKIIALTAMFLPKYANLCLTFSPTINNGIIIRGSVNYPKRIKWCNYYINTRY